MAERRRVVVTGAGSGIGLAIAEHLARIGDEVLATVRDAARAERLTDEVSSRDGAGTLRFAALELSDGNSIESFVANATAGGPIDLLVNNAGFGIFGAVEEIPADSAARQLDVNLAGPLALTRQLLPGLRERRGRIIWIGSLAGRFALPFQAHYSATKAAVAAMSDAMRIELAPHGVRVTCVEPGDFNTGFTDARDWGDPVGEPYRDAAEQCKEAIVRTERGGPNPEWVARVVGDLSRMERPPARRPVGQFSRILCVLQGFVPNRLIEKVVAKIYRVN